MTKGRFISLLLFLVFLSAWPGKQAFIDLNGQKGQICSTISEAAQLLESEGVLESISGQGHSNVFPRHLSKFKKDPFTSNPSGSLSGDSHSFHASDQPGYLEPLKVPLFLINRSILI